MLLRYTQANERNSGVKLKLIGMALSLLPGGRCQPPRRVHGKASDKVDGLRWYTPIRTIVTVDIEDAVVVVALLAFPHAPRVIARDAVAKLDQSCFLHKIH